MKIFVALLFVALANAEIAPLMRMKEKVQDQYIIKMKDGFFTSFFEKHPIFASLGGEIFNKYSTVFEGFAARLPRKALQFVRQSGAVEWVEEDGISHATATTWGIDRINQRQLPLDDSYSSTYTGAGVTVYIIDTGIYPDHEQFDDRASVGFDTVGEGGLKYIDYGIDCHGHGTHCAGSVGARDYGIATQANLVGVRVLGCFGSGTNSGVTGGCDWVAANAAHPAVASMSLGGGISLATDRAVRGMVEAGIPTAVAAGNDNGDACNSSPAREPLAITVGASDQIDVRAYFSNWGSCVDLFAPGVDIESCRHDDPNAIRTMSGTSMATPQVAGVLACLFEENPSYSPAQLWNAMDADVTDASYASETKDRQLNGSPEKLAYVH